MQFATAVLFHLPFRQCLPAYKGPKTILLANQESCGAKLFSRRWVAAGSAAEGINCILI